MLEMALSIIASYQRGGGVGLLDSAFTNVVVVRRP
jgi:hypothetical protein